MFLTFKFCLFRVIRELEAQLEYEREKREKLEAQMDKLRAQIHTLTLQLEDERSRHVTAVSITAYKRVGRLIVKGCFLCGVLSTFANTRTRGFKLVVGDEIVHEHFTSTSSYH